MIELGVILLGSGSDWYCRKHFFVALCKEKNCYCQNMFDEAQDRLKIPKRDIENERREAFLKIKDEIHKKRNEFDIEMKRDRLELDRLQSKLNSKYEAIEKKEQNLDELKQELQQKERNLSRD